MAERKVYAFEAVIEPVPGKGGAYVRQYDGSLVNMGVKNSDGSVCHIIGVRKDIQERIGKRPGDTVSVTIQEA